MTKENKKLIKPILEKIKLSKQITKEKWIRLRKNKKPKNSKHIVVSLIGKSPISIPAKLKKEWGNELNKLNAVTYMLEKYKEIWMHNPDKLSKAQFVKKYGNLFSQQYVIEEKARYAKTEPGEHKWLKDFLQPFVDNIEKLIYAPKKFNNIFLNLKDVVKRIIARQKLTKEEVNAIKYLFNKKDWKASSNLQNKPFISKQPEVNPKLRSNNQASFPSKERKPYQPGNAVNPVQVNKDSQRRFDNKKDWKASSNLQNKPFISKQPEVNPKLRSNNQASFPSKERKPYQPGNAVNPVQVNKDSQRRFDNKKDWKASSNLQNKPFVSKQPEVNPKLRSNNQASFPSKERKPYQPGNAVNPVQVNKDSQRRFDNKKDWKASSNLQNKPFVSKQPEVNPKLRSNNQASFPSKERKPYQPGNAVNPVQVNKDSQRRFDNKKDWKASSNLQNKPFVSKQPEVNPKLRSNNQASFPSKERKPYQPGNAVNPVQVNKDSQRRFDNKKDWKASSNLQNKPFVSKQPEVNPKLRSNNAN